MKTTETAKVIPGAQLTPAPRPEVLQVVETANARMTPREREEFRKRRLRELHMDCEFYRWSPKVAYEQTPSGREFNQTERMATYNMLVEEFAKHRINPQKVTCIENLNKFYEKYPKEHNEFITIVEGDDNYISLLKNVINMTSNKKCKFQEGMKPSSELNRSINEKFGWLMNSNSLTTGSLHVKKGNGFGKHDDYTFIFGVNNNKQRFIMLRIVEKISNDFVWEMVQQCDSKGNITYV